MHHLKVSSDPFIRFIFRISHDVQSVKKLAFLVRVTLGSSVWSGDFV